jgi:hypothetical protein
MYVSIDTLETEKAQRQQIIDHAILLHNKCKAVGATSLSTVSESISFLKGAASWLLSTYGYQNTKFLVLFIRLHCRVASEMISLGNDANALSSFSEATKCWDQLGSQALERILPPVELEGLRYVVFTALIDFSKLLRSRHSSDRDTVKHCVGTAMDLLPFLPSVRICFCDHVLELGQELAGLGDFEHAMHYIRIAHSTLHMIASQSYPVELAGPSTGLTAGFGQNGASTGKTTHISGMSAAVVVEVNLLRCKVLLTMAYVYQETGYVVNAQ